MSNVSVPTTGGQWYAIRTRAKQETRAEANLAAWGVETLLPKIRRGRRRELHHGRTSSIAALFPNYLFARFDGKTMASRIRYTRGVAQIVGTADGPCWLDDEIIRCIRLRVGEDGFVSLVSSLQVGDRLRITAGPLRDFEGVFESTVRPSERVKLLLATVSGQVRVAVEGHMVERV